MGSNGTALCVTKERPRLGVGGPQAAGGLQREEPILPRQPRARPHLQDRVHFTVSVGTGVARTDPARTTEGRATPRSGPRCLLRPAGPHQRPRAVGADEHLQLPDPDPRMHCLLAGAGNLPRPWSVRPGCQWDRSLFIGTRQPHRMGQCRALWPVHPGSEAYPPPTQGLEDGP